jgi:hypothetical protein
MIFDNLIALYFGEKTTRGETQKGVNKICQEPENGSVPVVFAIRAFAAKVKGRDPEEFLRAIRKQASQ